MRVTTSMYYDSLYSTNNLKISNELFDVNKQISSGLKIQYAKDDVRTFTETMRLDNEATTLNQITKSSENGSKISDQSDATLNEFTTSLDKTSTLLIQAANGAQSDASLDAIANELRGLEDHFKNLANTSIDGKYLFSGSAINTKPIADNGTYQGNDKAMNAFVGSNTQQQYNLSGAELFLGEEPNTQRKITSNTVNDNLLSDYPELQADGNSSEKVLSTSDPIRNLMGDIDNSTNPANDYYFYLRGIRSDGTAFNKKILLNDEDSIDTLLTKVGDAYGNSGNSNVVDVSMNEYGEIIVEDKLKGSSKLDFNMVGAVDFDTASDRANVTQIDNLDNGETDFSQVVNDSNNGQKDLYVKEFNKTDLNTPTVINGLTYDRTELNNSGSKLSANASQIVKSNNSFATPSTKLSEVADLSQGTTGTLDGTVFDLNGTDINGNSYSATINLSSSANNGSTFTIAGNTYDIYNMDNPRTAVDADEMTYQQLMDVVNMVVTNNLPAGNTATDYDDAIIASNQKGVTELSYDGKIEFNDFTTSTTKATMTLADSNSGSFGGDSSVMTFNTNDSLTVRDPKTDFFKTLDAAIKSVEEHKVYPDANEGTADNVGIENAIQMITDLSEHTNRSQAKVGAQSNSLTNAIERTNLLELSTMTLRSDVIDTDLAEASLRLTQLNNNYEAMLSTVGKVSQLSLVNYL